MDRTCRSASSRGAIPRPAHAEAIVARILIAEDEEPVRALVARALASDGHEVVTAADGAEALDKLQSVGGGFDLLLTDIKMPVMTLALRSPPPDPETADLLMTSPTTRARLDLEA
jgi:CheY-like chemotaxis protein